MNKTATIPDKLRFDEETASNVQKVELFNRYFQSVYTLHCSARLEVLNPKHDQEPTLTKFSLAKKSIRLILENADFTKSRGPEAMPPVFFQKLAEPMSDGLHLIFKAIKRTRTKPDE